MDADAADVAGEETGSVGDGSAGVEPGLTGSDGSIENGFSVVRWWRSGKARWPRWIVRASREGRIERERNFTRTKPGRPELRPGAAAVRYLMR
jgi:hypothetical protein